MRVCAVNAGEVALHIAIVNKELPRVELLVTHGASLSARAFGPFFQPPSPACGTTCYYGEYPLSFAACMAQPSICDYLLSHGADPSAQDSRGNTVMHMMVYHGLPGMYTYLYDKLCKDGAATSTPAAAVQPQPQPAVRPPQQQDRVMTTKTTASAVPLHAIRNDEGLTPLAMAARTDNPRMLAHLYRKEQRTVWSYGAHFYLFDAASQGNLAPWYVA